MRDAQSLLNSFLGQLTMPQAGGGQGYGQGQDQGQGLSGLTGGAGPSGGLGEIARGLNLDSLLSGKAGLATGAVAGGLAGLMLGGKTSRKVAGTALQLGGMALVGGLAYKAWSDWQANKTAASGPPQTRGTATPPPLPQPDETRFIPQEPAQQDDLSTGLIRAMIAAAKADGHISSEERARISEQLGAVDLAPEHMAFINAEMAAPLDVDAVARAANTPEQAAEIYAASLLCIDPTGAAEQGYLAMLAARLELPRELVDQLHASVEGILEPS